MYRSDKRIYVNADGSKIVDGDSPDAASLLVAEGGEIPDDIAKKYGLTGEAQTSETATDGAKEAKAAENKAAQKSETK